uniref:Photosystem II reaction center protein D2 n=1 Tax=Caulerpa cupressoides TaxID=148945 RepID=A0A3G2SD62_9CHLO|nr:photosystem II reaction center protein D2 [Caulerpa cupressoides]
MEMIHVGFCDQPKIEILNIFLDGVEFKLCTHSICLVLLVFLEDLYSLLCIIRTVLIRGNSN